MKYALLLMGILSATSLLSQVGINNTNPNATLEINASNIGTPSNEDGILIPRVDEFPVTDPGAAQDGMMVFITGNGTPTKGFYYWDNDAVSWISVNGDKNTLDEGYDEGGAGVGRIITADNGALEIQDTGGLRVEGDINAAANIVHDGDTNTFLTFTPDRVQVDAGGRNYMDIQHSTTEVTFNEDSTQSDFRVESGNQEYMLFVDGSNDAIGIGQNNPQSPLHVGVQTTWDLSYANTGQDGLYLRGSGDNSGQDAIGSSIGFGPPHPTRADQRKAAIASVQTSGDVDHLGLAFYIHANAINMSDMVEAMRITRTGLGVNNSSPDATLDVIGTMQFVDGNEASGYVLASDASGNATWTDPNTIVSSDIDWYEESTTNAPDAITDDIYTQGNVAIGKNTADYPLDVYANNLLRASNLNIDGTTNAAVYGEYITNSNSGGGAHYGLFSSLNAGTGIHYGTYNELSAGGTGAKYGTYNRLTGSGNAFRSGTYNYVTTSSTTANRGTYNLLDGTGTGLRYGTQNIIQSNSSGRMYGVYNDILSTGSGEKFGSYNIINASSGGTHYGVYSEATKTGSFAALFNGNVAIGTSSFNAGTPNWYIMPASRGSNGQVMQTDGAGNVSWVNAPTDTDWVDAGVDIERQSGDVYIGDTNATNNDLYISDRLIDWDNSSYYVDPASTSNFNNINVDASSETTPGIQINDTNTGFFSGTAGIIGVTTNGTERMRVQSDGELSIGLTTATDYLFSLNSLSDQNQIRIGNNVNSTDNFVDIIHNAQRGNGIDITMDNVYTLASRSGISVFNDVGDTQVDIAKYDSGTINFYGLEVSIPVNGSGVEYGVYSDVQTSNGYAGYFVGDTYVSGQLGVNLLNPSYAIHLPNNASTALGSGEAYGWDTYSDMRVKSNKKEIVYGLNEILAIQPKSYFHHTSDFEDGKLKLKEEGQNTIGFIAQELYKIIPEAVNKPKNENEELWSVNYDKVLPVAVKSIQELNKKVESLSEENQRLKEQLSKYESLEARLSALESNNLTKGPNSEITSEKKK